MELPEQTSGSTGELHVWRAQLDDHGWPAGDRLPANEQDRAAGLLRTVASRRWIAARWALRGVLGTYLDREPSEIELQVGSRGKPRLAAAGALLRFNLSHSNDLALVAVVREREVGVDVERIKPRHNLLGLSRRALPPADAAEVEAAPGASRPAVFHAAWARREAVAKCLGSGLRAPPPDAAVAVSDLDAGPGFAAAIAVCGDALPPLRCFAIRPSDLAR